MLYKKKKEGVSVSVQGQYLLLLQILPKFWSRFQLIGLKSTQRHKCLNGLAVCGTSHNEIMIGS